jgi:hypothetical protein
MAIGVGDNEAILAQATRDLQEKWQNTSATWRDKAHEDFDRKYLEEMIAAAKAAQHAMKNVNDVLRQAISDCA